MDSDKLIGDFLDSYAESNEWTERGFAAVAAKLCKEGRYSPKHGREFLLIALGWIWGRQGRREKYPYITANCVSGLIKFKLDEVWKAKFGKED